MKDEDSGIYVCSGYDQNTGATVSAQAQLTIESEFVNPPSARIEPKRLDIAQGESGSFRCISTGSDRVTWTRVSGSLNPKTTSARGSELHFYNTEVDDRGVYVCGKDNLIFPSTSYTYKLLNKKYPRNYLHECHIWHFSASSFYH